MFTLALSIYVLSIIVFLPRNARKALDKNQGCRRYYRYRLNWRNQSVNVSTKGRANDWSECLDQYRHDDDCWRDDIEVNTRDVFVGGWYGVRAPIVVPVVTTFKIIRWTLLNSNSLLLKFINRKASPQVAEKRKEQQIKELQANIRRLEQEKEEWERSYA